MWALGEYYPELLSRAIVTDMPWYVRAFVNIVWPFVDPQTKSKVLICPGEEAVKQGAVGGEDLLRECGGEFEVGQFEWWC